MFHGLAEWLKRRRESAELAAMNPEERDRVAHDLGISTNELDFLVRESHDPAELPQMLFALGIDEAALRRTELALLRDMQRTCSLCGEREMCRYEIRDGTAPLTYPSFCPNAEHLTQLLETTQPVK